eukprot:Platyproteum_vivax@DN3959_c0_g1_i1.p1
MKVSSQPGKPDDEDETSVYGEDHFYSCESCEIVKYMDKETLEDPREQNSGFYVPDVGEVLNERYIVIGQCGSGVYSKVFKCFDVEDHQAVAIKIMRFRQTASADTELHFLDLVSYLDPTCDEYIVKLHGYFVITNHVCLVFEWLPCNFRQIINRFSHPRGLFLKIVWMYSKTIFSTLKYLKKCEIVHADIKPDNFLVTQDFKLKLADFGMAADVHDSHVVGYNVSRNYRAPEIILGCQYDSQVDVWAAGATVFEAATGKILFPGRSNNEMLKMMIDLFGPIPDKLLRTGVLVDSHFKDNRRFMLLKDNKRSEYVMTKRKTLSGMLQSEMYYKLYPPKTLMSNKFITKKVAQLVAFLEKTMMLDPKKRITPEKALEMPWIKEKFQHIV